MKDKIIHNKLDLLQFSTSIKDGKFLIIKVPYIGYGGQLSIRILGMKLAYIFNRTVLFDDENNPYVNAYESISKISLNDIKHLPRVKLELYKNQDDKVTYLDFNEYWFNFKNRSYFDKWIPKELFAQHKGLEYFKGQLMLRYEPLPKYKEYIETTKKGINFSNPIIGIHIRRGDKKVESPYVPMRIYCHYLKKAVKETGIRKVFVTSDNDDIFSELPQDLGLEYIYDKKEKRYNNANHEFLNKNPTLKEQETLTAIKIIDLLSNCDCIIGQINAHFTTLAYNLSMADQNKKTYIYFVNRYIHDLHINNDPNIILFILDIIKKYTHALLQLIVRKIKPYIFTNEAIYKKIKELYYGEKR